MVNTIDLKQIILEFSYAGSKQSYEVVINDCNKPRKFYRKFGLINSKLHKIYSKEKI